MELIILTSFVPLGLGALIIALSGDRKRTCGVVALIFLAIASVPIYYIALKALTSGAVETGAVLSVPMIKSALAFKVDALSAIFLIIIMSVSLLSILFSVDYMTHYKESPVAFYPPFLVFIGGMVGVVTVSDMFFFLIAWEFMTLASYILVIFERKNPVNLSAGFKYFLMTHIATLFMVIGAVILYFKGDGFGFAQLKNAFIEIMDNKALTHLVLLFFFLGFATKAGIFPFGDWLPDAHPAAPSGMSAMLSGVMIKMGVYGLIRLFLDILPISHYTTTWGTIIALFGAISIVMGTLTALFQDDSKRLLAFSSIGQMGYMWLGIGMGIAFVRVNPAVSVVAIMAGLFHLINHACFKSCLFLASGSLLYKTGTRDLNAMGGLSAVMPFAAASTLIAALAISGIPPLNGFASKWMLYQVGIMGGGAFNPLYTILAIAAIFMSIVTLSYQLKFYGSAFLVRPSGRIQKEQADVPATMNIAKWILALACIAFGLFPMIPLVGVHKALAEIMLVPELSDVLPKVAPLAFSIELGEGVGGVWGPIIVLIAIAVAFLVALGISKLGGAEVREDAPWFCGDPHADEEIRFKARGVYQPFKELFSMKAPSKGGIYPVLPVPEFKEPKRISKALNLDEWLYYPVARGVMKFFEWFSRSHPGVPQIYALWIVVGAILAVIVIFALGGG